MVSRLTCAKPEEKLIWTAWGSPDFSGTQLTPELTALVQAGKASVSGDWSDPLVPVGFLNRSWHYGNTTQSLSGRRRLCRAPALYAARTRHRHRAQPRALARRHPAQPGSERFPPPGRFQYTRTNHRLGDNKTVSFTMHLVPHEASWRGGLRFMSGRYPQFFEAPNPRAAPDCRLAAPTPSAKRPSMSPNSRRWPSASTGSCPMISPTWACSSRRSRTPTRTGPAPAMSRPPPAKARNISCRQMNDYARYMKTERLLRAQLLQRDRVREEHEPQRGELSRAGRTSPSCGRTRSAFMKAKLPNACLKIAASDRTEWQPTMLPDGRKGLMSNCYGAAIIDPGDPDYLAFHARTGGAAISPGFPIPMASASTAWTGCASTTARRTTA